MKSSEIVSAPRGLLKIFIIEMATHNPISGNEVSERITSLTNEVWKPSPGSIYFILKELVKNNRLSEIYVPEKITRKYVTTEKGLNDLKLFRSFGKELILKQTSFLALTAKILKDETTTKKLGEIIEQMTVDNESKLFAP